MKTIRLVMGLAGVVMAGCGNSSPPAPSASASASAAAAPASASGSAAPVNLHGVPVGIPLPGEKVVAVVNPEGKDPYAGPKGTLKGTVRIDGDPPPDTGLKFNAGCKESTATYGKLFRVGLDKALADTMVAVTGYSGFVPAQSEAVKVTIHGCALSKRTVSATFGQRLEVSNLDKTESYMPFLDGAVSRAVMVAVPGGAPVKLYATEPAAAHYMIRDQLTSGFVADVFVLKYATHDVTGLDGQYEIKGIPVGKVRVDVFLPVIGKSEGRELEIKEGDNTLDFSLHFDLKKDMPKPAAAPSGQPSAAPSGQPKVPR